MSKAANIYWDNASRGTAASRRPASAKRRTAATSDQPRTAPWWLACLIAVSIFAMILVSINFRSFIELSEEVDQHSRLASQVQNLTDENLALQEEIHSIKTDPRVIEREARRIGIALKNEKVSVPAN